MNPFQAGDVVFVRGTGRFDHILMSFMKALSSDNSCHFSHTCFMLSDVSIMETSPTKTHVVDLWRQYRENEIKVLRYKNLTQAGMYDGYVAVKDQLGKMYPYDRLFLHALKLAGKINGTRMVCSELVAHFLTAAGVGLAGAWPDTDLLHDTLCGRDDFELVFFGKMIEHWPYGLDGPFIGG